MTNSDQRQLALNAIGEEAEKLLKKPLSEEAEESIQLIISIARYAQDVRTEAEKART